MTLEHKANVGITKSQRWVISLGLTPFNGAVGTPALPLTLRPSSWPPGDGPRRCLAEQRVEGQGQGQGQVAGIFGARLPRHSGTGTDSTRPR
jgi:hypothetical protein